MLSPSVHSVCQRKQLMLEQEIKTAINTNNKRRSLVLQLIRDGNTQSFLNALKKSEPLEYKKVVAIDVQQKFSEQEMIEFIENKLKDEPRLPTRELIHLGNTSETHGIRLMQWNILSEALGTYFDRFDTCSAEDLKWTNRRWKIALEVLQYSPLDLICMQEVDCFDYLMEIFSSLGYGGIFVPKPDSPCNHIENNIGPDGCAIFWKLNRLELLKYSKRILRVYKYQTNQVTLCATFKQISSGRELCVATTHLKARKGPILSTYRSEQGKDLIKFLEKKSKNIPLILCGDFNADPNEAVYKTITIRLQSVYKEVLKDEPLFTTWTKRQTEKEMKRTLDYIFYRKSDFKVSAFLSLDSPDLKKPIPNNHYPSDHLSLITHLNFI